MTSTLLAVSVLLIILIFYFRFFTALNKEPVLLYASNDRITNKDLLLLAAIVLIYGSAAFFRAGYDYAPETSVHFNPGDEVFFSIDEDEKAVSFKAYTGLNTGRYVLKGCDSASGEYIQIGELDQEFSNLFQWNDVYLTEAAFSGYTSFSLTALSDLYLNELVILNGASQPVEVIPERRGADASALFDEQNLYTGNSFLSGSYFDEIYHARTALEHIKGIIPYEITHPPLGKLIISAGIRLFGMNPFGWRFSGILFGILMLIPFYVLIKKLFSDTLISVCGTLLFAFDFMHYTQTRIATIDTYSVFFIILMYLFMYLYISADTRKYLWLGLCGLSFGFGCACKWTCIYAGAGLALIWLISFIKLAASIKKEGGKASACLNNILFCICFFVLIPAVIYYLSYIPYGKANGLSGVRMLFSREYFMTVADNQKYMFSYHSNIVAEHPYSSRWHDWMLDSFPMLYYLKYLPDGRKTLIACFVDPLICWSGLISVLYVLMKVLFEKDRRSAFILIGFIAQLLPWVFVKRLTFEYHYFPSTVFLILSVCTVFDEFSKRLKSSRAYIVGFTAFALILFVLFYPVISGYPLSADYSQALRWLPKGYL